MARPHGGAGSLSKTGKGSSQYWRGRWRSYSKAANGKRVVVYRVKRIGFVSEMPESEARMKLALLVNDDLHRTDMFSSIRLLKIANRKEREATGIDQSSTKGVVAELTVCVDLLKRGFEVFRAINPIGPCDLMIVRKGKPVRIEVKHGIITASGNPVCNVSRNIGKYDVLAMATSAGTTHYFDAKGREIELNSSSSRDSFVSVGAGPGLKISAIKVSK